MYNKSRVFLEIREWKRKRYVLFVFLTYYKYGGGFHYFLCFLKINVIMLQKRAFYENRCTFRKAAS